MIKLIIGRALAAAVAFTLLLVGCGGGGGGDGGGATSSPPPPPQQSAEGIWSGTLQSKTTGQTLHLDVVILATGESRMVVEETCTQLVGNLSVASGNAVSGTGTGYVANVCRGAAVNGGFPDGSKNAALSLTASVTTKSTLSGSYSVGGDNGTFTLTYDPTYDRSSGLATISGNYIGPSNFAGAIDANGSLSGSDANGAYTGKITLINTAHDVYRVVATYTPTGGQAVNFSGLGLLGDSSTTKQNDALVVTVSSSTSVVLLGLLKQ